MKIGCVNRRSADDAARTTTIICFVPQARRHPVGVVGDGLVSKLNYPLGFDNVCHQPKRSLIRINYGKSASGCGWSVAVHKLAELNVGCVGGSVFVGFEWEFCRC